MAGMTERLGQPPLNDPVWTAKMEILTAPALKLGVVTFTVCRLLPLGESGPQARLMSPVMMVPKIESISCTVTCALAAFEQASVIVVEGVGPASARPGVTPMATTSASRRLESLSFACSLPN